MPTTRSTLRRTALAAVALALVAACSGTGSPMPARYRASPGSSAAPASTPRPGVQPSAGATPATGDWTTYHGAVDRLGAVVAGPDPSSPGTAWRAPLDGAVYASPLVVGGHVLAATEGGSLYALDAGSGKVVWRTHLADPVDGSVLPCGNIDPIGITGTPVYDPSTARVFAVATQAGPRGTQHVLYTVDARTGRVVTHRAVDPPGIDPRTHLQRAALLLADDTVYVSYGGNAGDCGQYLGRVVGVATDGSGPLRSYAVPSTREAGIWGASGPAALPGGDLLVTTGNGEAVDGRWDHSDSVLRLSPTLHLRDGFAPRGWAQENSVDADLGSTGPLLLPGGTRALAAGKGGTVYLVDVAHLGGVGGQLDDLGGCRSFGGAAAIASPGGATAFLPCANGLLQVHVGPGDTLRAGWRADDSVIGSPVVVGHTVWSLQQDGTLVGLDQATGKIRASVHVGAASHFATPAVSGGQLFLPTLRGVTAVDIRG